MLVVVLSVVSMGQSTLLLFRAPARRSAVCLLRRSSNGYVGWTARRRDCVKSCAIEKMVGSSLFQRCFFRTPANSIQRFLDPGKECGRGLCEGRDDFGGKFLFGWIDWGSSFIINSLHLGEQTLGRFSIRSLPLTKNAPEEPGRGKNLHILEQIQSDGRCWKMGNGPSEQVFESFLLV